MLTILYFAKLKDDLDCSQETIDYQQSFTSIQHVVDYLVARHPSWQRAFNPSIVCALNQTIVHYEATVNDGDEIAFFPPVTGG